jgi:hypothetical protein
MSKAPASLKILSPLPFTLKVVTDSFVSLLLKFTLRDHALTLGDL